MGKPSLSDQSLKNDFAARCRKYRRKNPSVAIKFLNIDDENGSAAHAHIGIGGAERAGRSKRHGGRNVFDSLLAVSADNLKRALHSLVLRPDKKVEFPLSRKPPVDEIFVI